MTLCKATFLGCWCCLLVAPLLAQDQPLMEISGKVIDADSLTPLGSVHVYVLNDEQGTITNSNGFFSISMLANDTLVFSAVSYETRYYLLPDSLKRGKPFIEVAMKLRTVQLKEVVVYGQLNPAAVRRYLENINNKKREDNPPDIKRQRPTAEPKTVPKEREHTVGFGSSLEGGTALEGVLTGLANLFNKRAQQQKRINKLLEARRNQEAQRIYLEFIMSKFNEELVAEATGLSGASLERFMEYCNFSNEFIYSATEYELLAAIFAKLERFERYYHRYPVNKNSQ